MWSSHNDNEKTDGGWGGAGFSCYNRHRRCTSAHADPHGLNSFQPPSSQHSLQDVPRSVRRNKLPSEPLTQPRHHLHLLYQCQRSNPAQEQQRQQQVPPIQEKSILSIPTHNVKTPRSRRFRQHCLPRSPRCR
ncbi:unnamed protein product [Ectocarpus sp. 12 AP-2014]